MTLDKYLTIAECLPQEQKSCENAISRQAVLEIINDIRDCISVEGYCAILERVKKLQSAQPEIVRCKDCKHKAKNGFCEGRGWPMQLVPDDGFCEKGERSDKV